MPHSLVRLFALVIIVALLPARALATHALLNTPLMRQDRFLSVPMTGRRLRGVATTALFHTLFNDFASEADGTTYVQTGDIPAMWLRDSAAQTVPYLRFQGFYPRLRLRFAGVLERDARSIVMDPYANAFTSSYHVWERKWEIDSLADVVGLAWLYWDYNHDRSAFTRSLHDALRTVVNTYSCEQQHEACSHYNYPYRTQTHYNYAGKTGLIWSAFRPSDDAVVYRYNIPQQMGAVVALSQLAILAREGYHDMALARQAALVAAGVQRGIAQYGRYYDFNAGWTYVYETDGEGNVLRMDDANVPDLLAIPFMGYASSRNASYLSTRRYVLSSANPYYYQGRYASGLGSPHTPQGWVWPLGIITRGLTATSSAETAEAITTLAQTDSDDYLIHESFDPNAYWHFTRAEFGWANAFYAELIFRSVAGFPAEDYAPSDRAFGFEPTSQTPTLTSPFEQLENQGRIIAALGRLLYLLDPTPRTAADAAHTQPRHSQNAPQKSRATKHR